MTAGGGCLRQWGGIIAPRSPRDDFGEHSQNGGDDAAKHHHHHPESWYTEGRLEEQDQTPSLWRLPKLVPLWSFSRKKVNKKWSGLNFKHFN